MLEPSKIFLLSILFSVSLLSAACARSARSNVAESPVEPKAPPIPNGIGVNIHFTDPLPGEMKMLAASGVRWVRMDFYWQRIETVKGVYDFTPYDRLIAALDEFHLKALLILDYSNTLYDEGRSPHTAEGRRAFAKWAAASVRHFRGRGFYWEIYNEPNIFFWTPHPNVIDYTLLALECAKAIRNAAPDEAIIGPAVSLIDLTFLEDCFKAGLLDYWTAVSVHPYRKGNPESVFGEYARLRQLIEKHSPAGKKIPIISSEWGYSSVWHELDDSWQAIMLSRELLINHANGIALSIWYDWRDDGQDPKDLEHHWGLVFFPYYSNREAVFDVKPAYRAMQTLNSLLSGYSFSKRLGTEDDQYLLEFNKGAEVRWVVWTTGDSRELKIAVPSGKYLIFSHTGVQIGERIVNGAQIALAVTEAPQYVIRENR